LAEMGSSIGERAPRNSGIRKLSTHQQAVLIQILLNFPDEPVGVCCRPTASDAQGYAEDFLTVFKAINWSVERVEKVENLPGTASGLAIIVKEGKLPASAEALRDGLRIYQTEADIVEDHSNLCGTRNFVLAVIES
jgi:hypothetical protein